MPLEAVMIIVDNSESSRNGDYQPTRYEAQADAVSIIFQSIVQGNPESSVGLMSMGGKGPEVLVTLTADQGKILEGLHRTKSKIRGSSHLATGIQIAGLALKHRQEKSQRQRIIAFVCSPVEEDEKTLVKLAKKMKKNNVSIDFVLFGDLEDDSTQRKLQAFIDNVKGQRDSSNLVVIPPSGKLLSDQLLTTPILGEAGAAAAAAAAAAHGVGDGGEFGDLGFDPSVDPELALALRMSMEEERARQERVARQEAEAAARAALETVQEEAGESSAAGAPQAGGSGSADSAAPEKKDDKGKDDKQPEGGERMDTS